MAMTKIGPNEWRIRVSVRVPGKDYPVTKQETFRGTKTEAEGRKTDIIRFIRSGSYSKRSYDTFRDLLEDYKEKRNKTSAPDLSRIRKLDSDLGHVRIDNFADVFEEYLRQVRKTPTIRGTMPSHKTVNRLVQMVGAVFNLAVNLDRVESNPITKHRFPKAIEKPRDRYLDQEERERLLRAIREHRPHILPFVMYNLAVPCRKGELIHAKREQYNRFTNTVYVPDSKSGDPLFKPVPPHMVPYFKSIPQECPWLFYRHDRNGYHPLGDFRKAWAYCLKKAGIAHTTIHDLRHCSATDLYSAGNSERSIMDVAGWRTPMLSTYRHKDGLRSAQGIRFQSPSDYKATTIDYK